MEQINKYEQEKQNIQAETYQEYEQKIKELCKKLKV
jgi:hypothetical protein